jgi:hypothetical protein
MDIFMQRAYVLVAGLLLDLVLAAGARARDGALSADHGPELLVLLSLVCGHREERLDAEMEKE